MIALESLASSERRMKALQFSRFGSPEVLELMDLPIPLATRSEAVVRVDPFITAGRGLLDLAQIRPDETVIVFGVSGGVGGAVTQLPHWRGARVIGVDLVPPEEGPAGARPDLLFIGVGAPELGDAVREVTQGHGAAVGFDAVGGGGFEAHLGTLANGGRLAVIASTGERRVSFDLIDFYRRELRLFGVDSRKVEAEESARILKRLERGFLTGVLRPPHIAARFPLARAREAYQAVARGDAHGRVVLVPAATS